MHVVVGVAGRLVEASELGLIVPSLHAEGSRKEYQDAIFGGISLNTSSTSLSS